MGANWTLVRLFQFARWVQLHIPVGSGFLRTARAGRSSKVGQFNVARGNSTRGCPSPNASRGHMIKSKKKYRNLQVTHRPEKKQIGTQIGRASCRERV